MATVWPNMRRLSAGYARGCRDWKEINTSVQSWVGHAYHAYSWALRKHILCSVAFTRGG
jgi:hypothetical protein